MLSEWKASGKNAIHVALSCLSLSLRALLAVTNNWAPGQKGAMLISSWPQAVLQSETSRCQQGDSSLSIVFKDWTSENFIK